MESLQAFNFRQWIDANPRAIEAARWATSVCFAMGDFHHHGGGRPERPARTTTSTPGQEFFYQLEGDMVLKNHAGTARAVDCADPRRAKSCSFRPNMPHSPQRPAKHPWAWLIERQRRPGRARWLPVVLASHCGQRLVRGVLPGSPISKRSFSRRYSSALSFREPSPKRTCAHAAASFMERSLRVDGAAFAGRWPRAQHRCVAAPVDSSPWRWIFAGPRSPPSFSARPRASLATVRDCGVQRARWSAARAAIASFITLIPALATATHTECVGHLTRASGSMPGRVVPAGFLLPGAAAVGYCRKLRTRRVRGASRRRGRANRLNHAPARWSAAGR